MDYSHVILFVAYTHSNFLCFYLLGKTYFYAELPSGEKLFHRIQKAFPIQFGRDVLADQRLLNKPGAVDWRNCTQDKETETKMAKRFQKEFRKYDFNAL